MKHGREFSVACKALLILFLSAGSLSLMQAAEKAPASVVALANGSLARLGSDPAIVQAVKAENARGKSLDQIKQRDEKWISTPGVDDFMQAMLDNACSRRLTAIAKSAPYFTELFATDNQGANVGLTNKTSDYWQGDEAKFTDCFKSGAVQVSDIAFDTSSQSYVVQVSVPVKDAGRTIGVVVIGVDPTKVR